ncbi:hypothetical protein Q6A49_00270 [Pseudomonas sp. 22-AL-CL-001]|uniref:hypothetical protein n=1 Tax=Pseudomonas alabamensis TaxID=3064349 RepID=UPI00271337C2|nr:hypothetical protein [Pseudomonas sp. 22-AL-CL-001]MDO7908981.1 hypothetical protein [Pseudomonas sp. 22-AL-CL-001]
MKDLKTLTITPGETLKKLFSSHDMLKMSEYYSKTPMGGCSRDASPRQEFSPEFLECLPGKNSPSKK